MAPPGDGGLRIGANVRAARRSRGMSLEALAGLVVRGRHRLSTSRDAPAGDMKRP